MIFVGMCNSYVCAVRVGVACCLIDWSIELDSHSSNGDDDENDEMDLDDDQSDFGQADGSVEISPVQVDLPYATLLLRSDLYKELVPGNPKFIVVTSRLECSPCISLALLHVSSSLLLASLSQSLSHHI